ncbi:O-antigen ligase family protein [Salinibacterium sp. GXW1014]|uniref:O-antigen ligase family protein n=1 Tax=Salinibacterium sp. GXW1014 TaxID=3377838 RepID=UPI00383BCC73
MVVSFVVTLLHINPKIQLAPLTAVPEWGWYLVQFGPLGLAILGNVLSGPRFRWTWLSVSLVLLTIWTLASTLWSEHRAQTIAMGLVFAFICLFLTTTVEMRWRRRDVLNSDLKFVLWMLFAAMIAGALLYTVSSSAATGEHLQFQGVFPNPNYTASSAACAIPMAVWASRRAQNRIFVSLYVVIALVALVTIVATGSRGVLVAAAAGLVVAIAVSLPWRLVWPPLVGLAVLAVGLLLARWDWFFGYGAFFDRSDQGSDFSSGRFEIWGRVVELWLSHPVLGLGYRTVELLPDSKTLNAHNIYLSVLVELGLVGFLLFVGVIAAICWPSVRMAARHDLPLFGVVVTVLLVEMTEASLFGFGGPTATISWLLLLSFPVIARTGPQADESFNFGSTGGSAPEISVCMATYNGSAHVGVQISSILKQLGPRDELIIVDDASKDDTVEVVRRIRDSRIRLLTSMQNQGHVRTFERALVHARGRFIFLSDQDDVWIPGRVNAMKSGLSQAAFVATNWQLSGENNVNVPALREVDSFRRARNLAQIYLGRAPYFGCAMAFRRDGLDLILPFPAGVEAHDHWIAIAGNVARSMRHLEAPSLRRTIHENNLTPKSRRRVRLVVRTRLIMVWMTTVAIVRLWNVRSISSVTPVAAPISHPASPSSSPTGSIRASD